MLKREFQGIEYPQKIVAKVLLLSAEPIILFELETDEERDHYAYLIDHQLPVVMKGVMEVDLYAGMEYSDDIAGKHRQIIVTESMIANGKRRYGRGRLNVEAAISLAREYASIEHK
jgi:hypothetical protein